MNLKRTIRQQDHRGMRPRDNPGTWVPGLSYVVEKIQTHERRMGKKPSSMQELITRAANEMKAKKAQRVRAMTERFLAWRDRRRP